MLNDDIRMIQDAAERFCAEQGDSVSLRRMLEHEDGEAPALWTAMAQEQGWAAVALPEDVGGLNLGPLALVVILEQLGRRLLPSPLLPTVGLAATAIDHCALPEARQRLLESLAAGALRIAVPMHGLGDSWVDESRRLHARPEAAGWRLTGEAVRLLDGPRADRLLLMARLPDDQPGLFLVEADAEGLALTPREGWDRSRRIADAMLAGTPAERLDDPQRLDSGLQQTASLARLYLAAELLGVAQHCLDLTVAYTATRKQFGRPVGGFQAVKHRCAEMMVRIESLRSAVYASGARAAQPMSAVSRSLEGQRLKALASTTAFFCAQEAIQLHGGVGFTWEYDPQLYFKRAQATHHWLGSPDELLESMADELLAGETLPPIEGDVTQGESAEDRAFRQSIADWMAAHLQGDFAVLRHRGGPGDEAFAPALRKAWERELAGGGWTCVGWPKAHGGRELSIARQVIFHEEYARAGGPGRMGHIGEGLIGPAIIAFGTPEQQQRFLPDIVAGQVYWAQGYSEPGAGSDLANVQTKAVPDADGRWRVHGQKIWTSLAHESDWVFVLARCEPGSRGNKGLIFLLMRLDQPGIEIRPIRQLSGGCEFNEVFFDGAICEANDVLGAPGEGWKVAMGLLEIERGVSTLGQQMHFAHELDLVVQAARRSGRIVQPAIRARIAEAWAGLVTMRDNALRMLADGTELGLRREALIYKYYWSNWHRSLGKLAVDVLGAEADFPSEDPITRPLQQLFFFSRADTIYAGTNEIQLNLIAERGLGMPREARPGAA